MDKQYPLILVFYLDRELMSQKSIMGPFTESINSVIVEREANAMAFFLPTDGEERIECINPLMATKEQKSKIDDLLGHLKKTFDIGKKL